MNDKSVIGDYVTNFLLWIHNEHNFGANLAKCDFILSFKLIFAK